MSLRDIFFVKKEYACQKEGKHMIKNIVKTIMCVCAASALAACASAPMAHNRPDWTLNAGKHPQCQGVNDFCEFGISAVPLASDEAMAIQSAEDVARAKIAARVQTYSNAINKNFARAITAQGTTEVSKEVQQALETMAAGVVGIFIEIYSPGLMIPGIVGIISLVTSFYAFQALSANLAGILLVFVSFIFFLLEIKIMSYGLLSVGGAVSLLLGVMLLFDGSAGGLGVSPKMIIITITGIVLIVFVLAYIVFKAQVGRVVTGKEALVGERGVADTGLSPKGKVLVAGELWDAESEDGGTIPAGSEIIVSAVNGFRLRVSRLTERAE